MKSILVLLLAASGLFAAPNSADAGGRFGVDPSPIPNFTCGYKTITGNFTAKLSTYYFTGACLHNISQILVEWNAKGTYEPSAGFTTENINLNGASPYRGTLGFAMTCAGLRENQDPWLTNGICSNFHRTPQGEVASQADLLGAINQIMQSRGGPLTSSFPYDRNALVAKRDSDLRAEAAAIAKAEADQRHAEQMRQAALQPKSYMNQFSFPTILAPTAGARFLSQTAVPIRLAPPQGWSVTGYMVSIQKKATSGTWVTVTNIPVAAAQAQSTAGYIGFGAGGAGNAAVYYSSPGSWRLAAQITSPRQSGWSNPVEFVVTAPLIPSNLKSRATITK